MFSVLCFDISNPPAAVTINQEKAEADIDITSDTEKDKEEFLKQLLYIATIMAEFERRYREKQRGLRKSKEIEKIIKKYTKYIQEAIKNKNLDKDTLEKTIKELRRSMEKEIKAVSMEMER